MNTMFIVACLGEKDGVPFGLEINPEVGAWKDQG
jgi:hypothetical protein